MEVSFWIVAPLNSSFSWSCDATKRFPTKSEAIEYAKSRLPRLKTEMYVFEAKSLVRLSQPPIEVTELGHDANDTGPV